MNFSNEYKNTLRIDEKSLKIIFKINFKYRHLTLATISSNARAIPVIIGKSFLWAIIELFTTKRTFDRFPKIDNQVLGSLTVSRGTGSSGGHACNVVGKGKFFLSVSFAVALPIVAEWN